jgi:hypothetical protein
MPSNGHPLDMRERIEEAKIRIDILVIGIFYE